MPQVPEGVLVQVQPEPALEVRVRQHETVPVLHLREEFHAKEHAEHAHVDRAPHQCQRTERARRSRIGVGEEVLVFLVVYSMDQEFIFCLRLMLPPFVCLMEYQISCRKRPGSSVKLSKL